MHNTSLRAGEEQSFGLSPGPQRGVSALAKLLESTEVSDSSFSPVAQLLPGLPASPPAPTEGQVSNRKVSDSQLPLYFHINILEGDFSSEQDPKA